MNNKKQKKIQNVWMIMMQQFQILFIYLLIYFKTKKSPRQSVEENWQTSVFCHWKKNCQMCFYYLRVWNLFYLLFWFIYIYLILKIAVWNDRAALSFSVWNDWPNCPLFLIYDLIKLKLNWIFEINWKKNSKFKERFVIFRKRSISIFHLFCNYFPPRTRTPRDLLTCIFYFLIISFLGETWLRTHHNHDSKRETFFVFFCKLKFLF